MRIAICFSGQLRTGVWAIPAIKSFIGDLWENCDFFLHTWDSQYSKNYSNKLIENLNSLKVLAKEKLKDNKDKITNIINEIPRYAEIYKKMKEIKEMKSK